MCGVKTAMVQLQQAATAALHKCTVVTEDGKQQQQQQQQQQESSINQGRATQSCANMFVGGRSLAHCGHCWQLATENTAAFLVL
jgi:hypothetical protein